MATATLHDATRLAISRQLAHPDHPSSDMLSPTIKNLIKIPRPDAPPESLEKYSLEVEFYCLLQACGKCFGAYTVRSDIPNASQDDIDAYLEELWGVLFVHSHGEIRELFENRAADKAENKGVSGTGAMEELFRRLHIG